MVDENITEEIYNLKSNVQSVEAELNNFSDMSNEEVLEYMYYLRMIWGDFHLYIVEPLANVKSPATIVEPKQLDNGEVENVFNIHDEGYRLRTSRGAEGIALGHSLLKFYNTVEKMIAILVGRIDSGELGEQAEVRIAFYGHELAQRKAFESVLNLEHNVVVTNFDGGEWADNFMKTILSLADKGYGLPASSPRKSYAGPNTSPVKK